MVGLAIMIKFCENCQWENDCKTSGTTCNAIRALYKISDTAFREVKAELLHEYAKELDVIEYEVSSELQELGKAVIDKMPEVQLINNFDIKVGYVISYESKRSRDKRVHADCKKITGTYTAFLPFDFVITFYEPNISHMTDNQKKVLMLHELKHIGVGDRGFRIENHNIEDFHSILKRFGIDWNDYNQEIPDILEGGDTNF